jgi:hypothetical protein
VPRRLSIKIGQTIGAGVRYIHRTWGNLIDDVWSFDGATAVRQVVNYDGAERNGARPLPDAAIVPLHRDLPLLERETADRRQRPRGRPLASTSGVRAEAGRKARPFVRSRAANPCNQAEC